MDLAQRWLMAHGVEPAQAATLATTARTRARRYPLPVNHAWSVVLVAMNWLMPLVALGRLVRAQTLTRDDFERLEQALQHHAWRWPRMLWQFARLPLWEALYGGASRPPDAVRAEAGSSARAFDVIVIGSGAGGAPVATVLAERGLRVAILEAGGPVVQATPPEVIERYFLQQGMTLSLDGGSMPVFVGQGLGGTTAINSGTCLPPPQEWLARWDTLAGTHLAQELPPYVAIASERIGVTVPPRSLLAASAGLMDAGLRALGRKDAYVLPRNAPHCTGSGVCCFVCPTGAKQSTDRSFLPSARAHGAAVFSHARATTIADGEAGVTVRVRVPDGLLELSARHLVIAAGALQTPGLIRRNRLGARWRRAGDHLKIHPAAKVFALFAHTVGGEIGVPQGLGYQPPEIPRVVLEGIFTPKSTVSPLLAAAGLRADWWLARFEHLATFGLMVRDRGSGSVREFLGRPILRYRLHADDMRDMAQGLQLIGEAFFAAGAQALLLPLSAGPHEVHSVDALRQIPLAAFTPSRLIASGFHPQGTAGIGRVVDGDLRLTPHISVCDGSVLPDSPGVNPQLAIMGLSLRLADRLTAELTAHA